MGAHREREQEATPEQATATATAPASPLAALPAAGFLSRSLNRAGVIALQRLVGNAAVTDLIEERERPNEQPIAEARETAHSGASAESRPADVGGEARGAEDDLVDDAGSGLPAHSGASPERVGNLPAGEAIGKALEIATGAAGLGAGATHGRVNGTAPDPTEHDDAEQAAAGRTAGAEPGEAAGAARSGAAGVGAGTAAHAAAGGPGSAAAAGASAAAPGAAGAAGGAPGAGAGVVAAASAGGAPAAAAAGTAAGAEPAAAGPANIAEAGDVRDPHDDPNFKAMKGAARGAGAKVKTHQPAAAGAATAQGAAAPPGNDAASQAAAAQVDEMGKQQPGVFDRKAFIAAVKKAIDATAPKNLKEADEFKGSGKAGKAKDELQGLVKGGKKDSEKGIKEATDAPPDTSKATPKPVTPMVNDEPGAPPAGVGAAAAMPGPRPPEQTDLSAGPARVDNTMAEAGVTDEQVRKSNEPEFTGALEARDAAKEHSATAPGQYRAQEQDVLAKGRADAEGAAAEQLAGMHGSRTKALGKTLAHKGATKSADETKRAKVATDIQTIYNRTKGDVTKILESLDGKVDAAFTRGEAAARAQFEEYVDSQMRAYKDDRYSGWTGGLKWAKDKLFGMPDEVNRFYEQGRVAYLSAMDGVIGEVADLVGGELTAARARIAEGRAEVQKYVAHLPADLRQVGKEAEGKLDAEFDQLSSEIDNKQDALVDTLAQKYVESRDKLDSRIEELQAANKGLVNKALDAVVGVVKTILKLKDMLLNVLAKAADVIGDIISDPIGFLGNLISGVMSGLNRFVDNIASHLKEGLMGWLFGALGGAGLTLPKTLDFQGILDLVLQVLGLTYQNIRGRIAKLVGEPLVARMEKTVDVLKDFASKGIAGAWEWIKDKIGDLEDMVLGQIKEFVTSKVIKAGITWIISLLNPAAAFIKACKAIYDIVMFIVERGSEIMEFVNSILDSVGAIAKGALGAVAEKVEGALKRALPLAISFLASLLGLGGISEKIRSIIDAVRAPINKAIDFVVGGAVKAFKKMFGGAIGWAKGKVEKGKAFVKGKVEAGKALVKGKAQGIKDRLTGGGKQPGSDAPTRAEGGAETPGGEAVKARVRDELAAHAAEPVTTREQLDTRLAAVMAKYRPLGLKSLGTARNPEVPEHLAVVAEASPITTVGDVVLRLQTPDVPALQISLDYLSPETHVFYSHPGGDGETRSEGGLHAEDHFYQRFKAWLSANPPAHPRGSEVPVTLQINRTPCDRCALLLATMQREGVLGRKVQLTVQATSVYGGKKWEKQLVEGNVDRSVQVETPRSSIQSLAAMRAAGVVLDVWDIWSHIGAAVLANDPRLEGLDPAVLKSNIKCAKQLEGYLIQVERSLATVPRFVGNRSR